MIRKAVIVVLTVGAAGSLTLAVLSSGPGLVLAKEWGPIDGEGPEWVPYDERWVVRTARSSGYLADEVWRAPMGTPRILLRNGFCTVNLRRRLEGPVKSRKHGYRSRWLTFGVGAIPPIAQRSGYRYWNVHIALLLPFCLLAPYPTIALVSGPLRRWRRRKRGECVNCGYNLTGNVTGVCSECGQATR